ncbi:MAG: hypothetical protein ACREQN_05705 [Candidatus Binataceae bacterium]
MLNPSKRFIRAGGRAWYTILALSFLLGIVDPFVILAYVLGLHIKNGYSGDLGLTLTTVSYLASLIGFAVIERVAFLDGNVRSLEIASILALPIAFVAFLAGMAAPSWIMWPIAGGILLVSMVGLHAADSLVPKTPAPGDGKPKPRQQRPEPATTSIPVTAARHKRDRRRSRARRRPH